MNGIEFEVTGRKGLFTCPEFKVGGEKCTLQIPTYEALKGITKSIIGNLQLRGSLTQCVS